MFGGFKKDKLRPNLKMAVSRFEIASNKKSALMKQQMREIAKLLDEKPPKEEKARIRAEALIRDDGTIEAYEILQLSCELLSERIKLISSEKNCPEDLKGTISTLMWASNRVDIPELIEIRKQFAAKYGKKFETNALGNKDGICNERIMAKLSFQPPSAFLVHTYLEKIAEQFDIDWKPAEQLSADELAAPMAAPSGSSVPVAPGSGLAAIPVRAAYPIDDGRSALPIPMPPPSVPPSVAPSFAPSFAPSLPTIPVAPGTGSATIPVRASYPMDDGRTVVSELSMPPTASDGGINSTPSADIPFAEVMPPRPDGKNDEGEINVPPIAAATYVAQSESSRTGEQNSENIKNDYDSLAARFENLKK